ncbi:MAG: hypothetical protein HC869_14470 [Rhodospirillales bacterium]|nr:hypothetical protein [Rhodospirillales bacterium]
MKARQLIGSASYGPDVLKVIYAAFDDAWTHLAPMHSATPLMTEATRLKLANIILSLAEPNSNDADSIKNAALHIMAMRDKT